MTLSYNMLRLTGIFITALLLTACGGGNNSSQGNNSTFSIGGNVTGLINSGLIVRNSIDNDADSELLTINADGNFTFTTELETGSRYHVFIEDSPPNHSCNTSQGLGTVSNQNITDIAITCEALYTVGGSITGIPETNDDDPPSVVLQNNGGDNLTLTANGDFTFPTKVQHDFAYNVTVLSEPEGIECVPTSGEGTINAAIVTDVVITCNSASFTIGGSISTLNGSLTLRNGNESLTVNSSDSFEFTSSIPNNASYNVSVVSNPSDQNCTVSNGLGVIDGADVTNISVSCVDTYSIGGTVTGMVLPGLVLQNNGDNNLDVDADGNFAFSQRLLRGNTTYNVSIFSLPNQTSCEITNHTNVIGGQITPITENISDISITCIYGEPTDQPELNVSYGAKQLQFSWEPIDRAANYQILESSTGVADCPDPQLPLPHLPDDLKGKIVPGTEHQANIHLLVNNESLNYYVSACNSLGFTTSNVLEIDDELAQAIGYFKASNAQTGDNFGSVVALSDDGNTLAVSAPFEDSSAPGVDGSEGDNLTGGAGAVYIFSLDDGKWAQEAYIKASNPGAFDLFGSALDLNADGSILAVGAYLEASDNTGIDGDQADESAPGAGAVYIFELVNGNWLPQTYIKASNTQANDRFGKSIALSDDGNTLAVGAPNEDSSATGIDGTQISNSTLDSGAVYVFTFSDDEWTQQTYIKASNTDAFDLFGSTLALSGDGNTLAVSSLNEASNTTSINGSESNNDSFGSGAVYIFTFDTAVWSQQAYIKASNSNADDRFGFSLALSTDGNTLAVGAPNEDGDKTGGPEDNNAQDAGATYIYSRSGTTWSQQTYLKADNAESADQFGYALSLSSNGNTLAVGAPFEDSSATWPNEDQTNNGAPESGASYLYTREGTEWTSWHYVKAPNAHAMIAEDELDTDNDQFGYAVSLSGDGLALAVGANFEDSGVEGVHQDGQEDNSAKKAGAVYLY